MVILYVQHKLFFLLSQISKTYIITNLLVLILIDHSLIYQHLPTSSTTLQMQFFLYLWGVSKHTHIYFIYSWGISCTSMTTINRALILTNSRPNIHLIQFFFFLQTITGSHHQIQSSNTSESLYHMMHLTDIHPLFKL